MSWIVEMRRRLASPAPRKRAGTEDRAAAVLVPVYVDARELWVLLTRRSDDLEEHRSQVAFPGGKREPGEEPWDAALREAEEETGVNPAKVLRLGELDEIETPTGYRITPCVGAIPWPFEVRPSPAEIAEVLSIPLSALANPQLVEKKRLVIDDVERDVVLIHVGRHRIWGATAAILVSLLQRLGMVEEG